MSLRALSRTSIGSAVGTAPEHTELDEMELGAGLLALTQLDTELNQTEQGINLLCERHDVIATSLDKGDAVVKSQVLEMAANLMDMGMHFDDASALVTGLESESVENVGNEAWATITKAVKDLIDWAAKKLEEAIEWATKIFNKFFGSYEKMKKQWEKVQTSAENKSDQVIGKDNKDREYTSSADYYYVEDKLQSVNDLAEFGGKFNEYLRETLKVVMKNEVRELSKEDILNNEGRLLAVADINKVLTREFAAQKGLKFSPENKNDAYNRVSEPLPGRVSLFSNNIEKVESFDDLLSAVKTSKLSILPTDPKSKSKDKAKVEFVAASEVASIASTQIELMDNVIDMMRGPAMKKADKALRKLAKDIKAWNKDVPGESATLEEKNDYKAAVKLATSWVGYERRRFITQTSQLASYVRQYSGALKTVCSDSLSAHEKA